MATLTRGTTVITPALVLGWDSTRTARTVVHTVLDRIDPDVSLRPAGLRTGTLSLFFLTAAEALACETAHASAGVWVLDGAPEVPELEARYVAAGELRTRTEGEDHDRWVVEVAYQEVAP